ncbi:HET-domain-containing protein [Lophiostoma macrostomum CBS 122681]|uniref:HET-domain-containing protein n=1 Tax=Lophiostoma macrostomum CBS 122681 TaxID=1314788 RepID=A0A6A6SM98_9PLEO|nr:HET-domain-containing protein [Lophiostoma macrostomum CBS 122681]
MGSTEDKAERPCETCLRIAEQIEKCEAFISRCEGIGFRGVINVPMDDIRENQQIDPQGSEKEFATDHGLPHGTIRIHANPGGAGLWGYSQSEHERIGHERVVHEHSPSDAWIHFNIAIRTYRASKCRTCSIVRLMGNLRPQASFHFCRTNSIWYLKGQPLLRAATTVLAQKRAPRPGIDWIDLGGIKQWLRVCDDQHSGHCHSFLDAWRQLEPPTRLSLIDVQQLCLVHYSMCRTPKYLALSYVWGRGQQIFQTTSENFASLSQKGAFKLFEDRLPRTIKDAIILTRLLGLQYIWIDRFCYVQDEIAHQNGQIEDMAAIHANAYLTLVASGGEDDSEGLRGIDQTGQHRNVSLCTLDFSETCAFTTVFAGLGAKSKYRTRGWTYQEFELSPRKLIFDGHTAIFVCSRGKASEDISDLTQAEENRLPIITRFPSIYTYSHQVENYFTRQLSYPTDALRAFSAVIELMRRALPGGILFGIPEAFFDGCMFWRCSNLSRPPLRRVDRDGKILKGFPSWSWVGWTGGSGVDTQDWRAAHHYYTGYELPEHIRQMDEYRHLLVIRSTVEWYKRAMDHTSSRERVQNLYYTTQLRANTAVPVPPFPGYTFIGPPETPLPRDPTVWSPILEFCTERVYRHLADHKSYSPGDPFKICDSVGRTVENLHPDCDDIRRLPAIEPRLGQMSYELIGISKGEVNRGHPKWYMQHATTYYTYLDEIYQANAEQWYKYQNVLWIEWEEGIAYRRGIGEIAQKHWDKSTDKETIDVSLG